MSEAQKNLLAKMRWWFSFIRRQDWAWSLPLEIPMDLPNFLPNACVPLRNPKNIILREFLSRRFWRHKFFRPSDNDKADLVIQWNLKAVAAGKESKTSCSRGL
jgi:hypothetical protein